jgi:hypothetical protein
MADIATLKAALDEAEAAKETLIAERRANRESMTRTEFRAFNESTRVEQIETERAVQNAQKALAAALNDVRAEALNVAVGTVNETNKVGGAS